MSIKVHRPAQCQAASSDENRKTQGSGAGRKCGQSLQSKPLITSHQFAKQPCVNMPPLPLPLCDTHTIDYVQYSCILCACVCVCVCVLVCVFIGIFVYALKCVRECPCVCVSACVCRCVCVGVCVCRNFCVYFEMCVRMPVCVSVCVQGLHLAECKHANRLHVLSKGTRKRGC